MKVGRIVIKPDPYESFRKPLDQLERCTRSPVQLHEED
jgi:hypothetical protein